MPATFTRFQRRLFYIFIILLTVPALFVNLGTMAMIDDEAIRALVAMEMDISGNYIVPTVNGELYYNKPPLYNWFLLFFYHLFGSYEEWVSRSVTVLCLIGYAATVFYYSRRHYSTRFAFINAFFLITCGRILWYDSMLGLIDLGYSWLTFTSFMIVYHAGEKRKYGQLFLLTYLLTAAGFLLKGLPSVVFQGATLGAYFLYRKDWRRLFGSAHFAGIGLFLLIVGSYYITYHQYHSVADLFDTIVNESTKRTAAEHGMADTVKHLFTFPFEFIYHFLPWTILVVFLFRKDLLKVLAADTFITFCCIIFLADIVVYWVSVEVYPRYLFMHLPLLFTVLLHLYFREENGNGFARRLTHIALGMICATAVTAAFVPLFLERAGEESHLFLKCAVPGALLAGLNILYYPKKRERLLITVAVLLIARLLFNWFVIPDRHRHDRGTMVQAAAAEFGRQYQERPLYFYRGAVMERTTSYYITRESGQIFRYTDIIKDTAAVYLIQAENHPEAEYQKLGEVPVRYGNRRLTIVEDFRRRAE